MTTPDRAVAPFDAVRFLRDITGLHALPAFWSGSDPAFVLDTFFGSLESLLGVTACYGSSGAGAGGSWLEIARINRRTVPAGDPAVASLIAFAREEPQEESRRSIDLGGRRLACVRMPIGYTWTTGYIAVGAPNQRFPDVTEQTLLRTALSLAASGLETARLIRERDSAQQAKDEFLAMLGHELRNPLAPIVTATQLMRMKAGQTTSRELDVIERQVAHLRGLVDDLLDVSRVSRGLIDLHVERIAVADVVARAIDTVMPLIEQGGHTFDARVAPDLVVDGDLLRLTQVVTNLLTNAARYTPRGGHIDLTAERLAGQVQLRVRDNGPGIAPDLLPRVFELFVQGTQTLARREGGLGIGLALARRLVLAHQGSIAVSNRTPGPGTEATVTLPLAASRPATAGPLSSPATVAPAAPGAAGGAASGARVLVVDDNTDAADLAAVGLARAGYTVDVAYTARGGLAAAATHQPDVALLDIGLPDLDGYALAAELRERHDRGLSLIALTGYGQAHDRARAEAAGFVAHLVKPIDLTALVNLLARVAPRSIVSEPSR